ncbi:DNA polymerase III subunit delta' [Planctomicrobium sp. SH664]|uniref:DNA polymerase III subunit delta' n=1 Tax=Planctomicrobium sp. SH664 TaxID=3448125 RepID=UPI003F5C58A9
MIWERVIGHQQQVEMFRRAIRRGRLAHAYLLVGPSGIGKRLFARTLAQCLFCERYPEEALDACGVCSACCQMEAGTHPDLLTVELPEGKRELPIELLAGDRDHRGRAGLCYDLALKPMSASRRIALIDAAETMNEASANSLLKTLEEPPVGSILFLLTPETEPILPTIRSRCQPIRFHPLTDEQVLTLLQDQQHDGQLADVVRMSEGSPSVARQLLEPALQKLWKTVEAVLSGREVDALKGIQQITTALEELGTDSASQRLNMRWALKFVVEALRKQLQQTEEVARLDQLGNMLDRCFEADLHLRQTMPIPLCLEALMTDLGRQSR